MTYRESRERKAERLREWAEKREAKSVDSYEASRAAVEHIPFGQPILVGHHSEAGHRSDLARSHRAMDRSCEHSAKAAEMRSRADNIEKAARGAIYSDDHDAAERLVEKVAKLEAQRDAMKARNAAYRKEHGAELKAMSAYERHNAVPFPAYAITNIGAKIRNAQKRLASIQAGPAAARTIVAKWDGSCAECNAPLVAGSMIRYSRSTGALCAPECGTDA